MSSIERYRFPGMDPWLESRAIWPGVHDALVVHMAEEITRQAAPAYVARPGRRVVVEGPDRDRIPDVAVLRKAPILPPADSSGPRADPAVVLAIETLEVKELFIEVRSVRDDMRVVAIVELLSRANKIEGTDSRTKYLRKQQEVLSSGVHLVEIDLLRAGSHTVAISPELVHSLPDHVYRVVVRRATSKDEALVYPIGLRERLPRIPIPLAAPDPDLVVDLQSLVERVYVAGAYGVEIDYAKHPEPRLSRDDLEWAKGVLGPPT